MNIHENPTLNHSSANPSGISNYVKIFYVKRYSTLYSTFYSTLKIHKFSTKCEMYVNTHAFEKQTDVLSFICLFFPRKN